MREREFKVLQKQAYQYIKDQLNSETLKYNTIYSESKLALEMGISRTPVRDAVHRLYQEGLIDIIPNKGFALHKMTEKDIIEIYEVRSAIEGYCAQKAAETIASEKGKELFNKLQFSLDMQQKILASTKDIFDFVEHDQNFHNYLVCYSGNDAFIEIFSQYMYKIKKLACYSLKHQKRMEDTLKEHSHILSAIEKGDAQKAYSSTLLHMKAPLNINLETVYE
ncbi:GntR family transcriptional regulator [Clostridium sp. MCC353]|uniref:GntR family transcriptional regulator n=1 Tax=Clostridium sp. MCC353 TaxID=2592646 RepID=UPI001C0135DF|nr:GntR family transcriptional regulator [Clostridium sp. MCC353]